MGVRICLGCLQEVPDSSGVCPLCGFSLSDPVPFLALPPKTVLQSRYVVGKAQQIDGEGITYAAYDVKTSGAVLLREYMPSELAERNGTEVVPSTGNAAKFKALKSDFMDLYSHLAQWKNLTNIRRVEEVFEQNGTVYAACEYLTDYKTLNQYLNENAGEIDWSEAADLFRPLMQSLLMINRNGFIHRGLSPENIVLTADGTLKLIGFSICSAKVVNSEIKHSLADGYAAPEQYMVAPHGEWTDVYGMCAVLYKVLSGTRPPSAPTRAVNDNLMELSELNSAIPVPVSKAIMAGLRYDYNQRVHNLEQLMDALYHSSLEKTNVIMSGAPLFDPYAPKEEAGAEEDEEEIVEEKKKHSFFDQFFEDVDDDEEEEEEEDDESASKSSSNSKKNDKIAWEKGQKEEKEKKPVWLKVLIASIPVIFICFLLLYQALIGFSFFGSDNKKASSSSSKALSSSSSEASSSRASSQPTSSKEEEDTITMVNFLGQGADVMDQYSGQFTFGDPEYAYSDEYTEGLVCGQSIAPGTEVTAGQTVTLTISRGKRIIILPSSIGYTPDSYSALLMDQYGINSTVEREYSDAVAAGYITRTIPGAGESYDRASGATVVIYQSIGPDPSAQSSEPDSNSQPEENADDEIE